LQCLPRGASGQSARGLTYKNIYGVNDSRCQENLDREASTPEGQYHSAEKKFTMMDRNGLKRLPSIHRKKKCRLPDFHRQTAF